MPLPVLTVEQMRAWEMATWAAGTTEAEVIARVGKEVAACALRLTNSGDRILVLAGKGHNGDDARAVRKHLVDRTVDLVEVTTPAKDLSALEKRLAEKTVLLIDGLFGIGLNRRLSSEWVRLIETINGAGVRVLSVDAPSGLNAETGLPEGAAVRASITMTVGAPKQGLLAETAWECVGRLEVTGDVGLVLPCPSHSDLVWVSAEDFRDFPPARKAASHKGSYGHVAIIAGSTGFHGAGVLAARGAQRAQPGLVTLHVTPGSYAAAGGQLQAVMVKPGMNSADFPGTFDAVVIGPGLAGPDVRASMKAIAYRLWQEAACPVVMDASALAWLEPGATPANAIRVMTPHPGEAARLLGWSVAEVQGDRVKALRTLSGKFRHCWVVLKGHQTLVGRSEGEISVNSSGNPYLAQGGSGDVLAGYIGGLIAQPDLQQDPGKTIRYAVWQHGAAADRLQERRKGWVVEELIEELGR